MGGIEDHDDYIAAAPEAFRKELARLREVLGRALPEAEEMVAYRLPGFAIDGAVVASYAAFSRQCGVYFLAPALAAHAPRLLELGYKPTKTGVTFAPSKPLPDEVISELARSSAAAVQGE